MKTSDPAAHEILERARVVRIATLSRNARPSVTSIYFVLQNNHIWIGTSSWTLAAREALADSRVSLLFNVEQNPNDHRILRVTGRGVVRTDKQTNRSYNRRVALKYMSTPAGIWHYLTHLRQYLMVRRYHAQNQEKGQPCVIDVTPEQFEFLDAQ